MVHAQTTATLPNTIYYFVKARSLVWDSCNCSQIAKLICFINKESLFKDSSQIPVARFKKPLCFVFEEEFLCACTLFADQILPKLGACLKKFQTLTLQMFTWLTEIN